MRIAAVQMTSTVDVERNLEEAGRLVAEAARDGADLVVLPENFSFLGADDAARLAAAEPADGGPAQAFLADAARRHGIWLVGGTVPIAAGDGRARSRSLLLGPDGAPAAHYDKIHLFDVDVPGGASERYRESATTVAGETPVVAATPLGRIGLVVCYDIRFPGLFHRLGAMGMEVLCVPAAFTVPTGRAHWHTLLRARAIESLVYVVASGQWGEHAGGRRTFGHSTLVAPWGETLAERAEGAGVVAADVDLAGLRQLRDEFPVIRHRREL